MECYLDDKHLRTFYVIEKLVLIYIYCFLKRGKVCIYNHVKKKLCVSSKSQLMHATAISKN